MLSREKRMIFNEKEVSFKKVAEGREEIPIFKIKKGEEVCR